MLFIKVEKVSLFCVAWKFSDDDFKKAIAFKIDNANVGFNFVKDEITKTKDRQWIMDGDVTIRIREPSKELLDGLNNPSSINAQKVAEYIYKLVQECIRRLIVYSRLVINLDNIDEHFLSFDEIFRGGLLKLSRVYWSKDGKKFNIFELKIKSRRSRKIRSLYKSRNLLTADKWEKLRKFVSQSSSLPSREIEELLRIKHKAIWSDQRRISTLETIALVEVKIRNIVQKLILEKGVSKNKIDNIKEDVGLSVLLNLLLPMILNKAENIRYKKHIDYLDNLRKLRNDIMHENVPEEKIDEKVVYNGVKAAIKVILFLEKKFKSEVNMD